LRLSSMSWTHKPSLSLRRKLHLRGLRPETDVRSVRNGAQPVAIPMPECRHSAGTGYGTRKPTFRTSEMGEDTSWFQE
jgi:hypothetical protein